MDSHSLLELLKLFWLMFEVIRYFIRRQKEKALANSLERLSQRISELEKSLTEKSESD
jgi:hypothetical protein